jgi:outer membrane protein TolC
VRILIPIIAILFVFPVFAQEAPAVRENVAPAFKMPNPTQRPPNFEDYLVQIAWQSNPDLEGHKYEIDARKHEITLAKKDWTRFLQAGINLNDVTLPSYLYYNLNVKKVLGNDIDPKRFTQIATFPMWNVGLGISFGDLMMRKNKVKYAENRRKMSESDLNAHKQKIRAEVLKRYQEFLLAQDILKVRIQVLDVAQANKTQMESLFAVNKIAFADLNHANKAYFDALEAKMQYDATVKLKKIAMEEILGVRWETVDRIKGNFESKN